MRRLKYGKALMAVGAVPCLLSSEAWAAAAVHTPASVEIREAATVTVVSNPPLQLLLSSGSETTFTVNASSTTQASAAGAATPTIDASGAWANAGSSGEVLSVSLAAANEGDSSGAADAPPVRVIIAQFN